MNEDKILGVVWDNHQEWTNEQIGNFIRKAFIEGEDKTLEEIEKEIEMEKRGY